VDKQPEMRRQVVKFSFYRVDPAWRGLPPTERQAHKAALCETVAAFADRLQVRSYSVAGMRGDADILLWQVGDRLDDIQELA
jgi:chlorite dismutase